MAGWTQGRLLWVKRSQSDSGLVLVVQRRLGTAVARNRVKRRLRRLAQPYRSEHCGLVVMARAGAPAARFADLAAEFQSLVDQIAEE